MDNWLFRLIQRLTPVAIVIAGLALISVIVLVFMPEWAENFPYLRDSVTALSTAAMVIATLSLAYATLNVINSDRQREERNKKERLLNEIIDWATDVRKYASIPHIIDPNSYNRMMSADRFFTLKYNGKKFLIAVKKQAIGNDLQSLLSNAIEFLDKNWRDFATKRSRLEEIVKELDKIGETIIEKAEDLLSRNS